MIRLSIVIPSNRDDYTAYSRIAQACSWASPHLEVIVRDNSGSAKKKEVLAQFNRENCHVIVTAPCETKVNWAEAVSQAKGDFTFILSDDDASFERAVSALPAMIEDIVGNPSIIGVTGTIVIEHANGSSIFNYQNIHADDALVRLDGYLSSNGPNVLLFSPIRRQTIKWVFDVVHAKPFSFSFDDQLCSLLYLLRGKFVRLNRLMYCYDMKNWQMAETAQQIDLSYYTAAKLDPAINKLHWLLCGFEGAALIRNLAFVPDYPLTHRQAMADLWFGAMFNRFKLNRRYEFNSPHSHFADMLCEKWKVAAGQLSFHDILTDICQFLGRSSQDNSQKYYAFWSSLLGIRHAPAA